MQFLSDLFGFENPKGHLIGLVDNNWNTEMRLTQEAGHFRANFNMLKYLSSSYRGICEDGCHIYITTKDKNMKTFKILALAAFIFASIATSQAQTVDLGIKTGLNYGSLPSGLKELSDEAGKMGFTVGAFARVGDNLYFQPEVNFSTYSSKYTFDSQKFQPKFRNLNVPLMVGYKLVNEENLKFRLSLGPDLSYSLKGVSGPANSKYKKFNAGGVLNVGVDLGLFTVDARYSRGLTKANEELDQKTGIFNLSVGFIIN